MEQANVSPSTSPHRKLGVEIGTNGGRSEIMAGVEIAGVKMAGVEISGVKMSGKLAGVKMAGTELRPGWFGGFWGCEEAVFNFNFSD